MANDIVFFKRGGMLGISATAPGVYSVKLNGYINGTCVSSDCNIIKVVKSRVNGERHDDKYIVTVPDMDSVLQEFLYDEKKYSIQDEISSEYEMTMTALKIPAGSVIEEGFLSDCFNLQTLVLPDDGSLTAIGPSAFMNCRQLTGVVVPDSVLSIGDGAFMNCTGMQYARYPKNAVVGTGAFKMFQSSMPDFDDIFGDVFENPPTLLATDKPANVAEGKQTETKDQLTPLTYDPAVFRNEWIDEQVEHALSCYDDQAYLSNLHGYTVSAETDLEKLSGYMVSCEYSWTSFDMPESLMKPIRDAINLVPSVYPFLEKLKAQVSKGYEIKDVDDNSIKALAAEFLSNPFSGIIHAAASYMYGYVKRETGSISASLNDINSRLGNSAGLISLSAAEKDIRGLESAFKKQAGKYTTKNKWCEEAWLNLSCSFKNLCNKIVCEYTHVEKTNNGFWSKFFGNAKATVKAFDYTIEQMIASVPDLAMLGAGGIHYGTDAIFDNFLGYIGDGINDFLGIKNDSFIGKYVNPFNLIKNAYQGLIDTFALLMNNVFIPIYSVLSQISLHIFEFVLALKAFDKISGELDELLPTISLIPGSWDIAKFIAASPCAKTPLIRYNVAADTISCDVIELMHEKWQCYPPKSGHNPACEWCYEIPQPATVSPNLERAAQMFIHPTNFDDYADTSVCPFAESYRLRTFQQYVKNLNKTRDMYKTAAEAAKEKWDRDNLDPKLKGNARLVDAYKNKYDEYLNIERNSGYQLYHNSPQYIQPCWPTWCPGTECDYEKNNIVDEVDINS